MRRRIEICAVGIRMEDMFQGYWIWDTEEEIGHMKR